jgi:hypothetical protein
MRLVLVPINLFESILVLHAILTLLRFQLVLIVSALHNMLLHRRLEIWNFMKNFKSVLSYYLSSTNTNITVSTIVNVKLILKSFQILTREGIRVIVIVLQSSDFIESWNLVDFHRFHLLFDNKITFTISTKNSNVFFRSTFKIFGMKNFLEFVKFELLFLIILTSAAGRHSMVLRGSDCWNMGVRSSNLSVVVWQSIVY